MRVPPAEVVAGFPPGDPENPHTMGPALVVVNAIFMAITALAVWLRLHVRATVKRQLGADDFFIAVALVFAIGLGVNSIIANQLYGWDRHIWELPFSMYPQSLQTAMSGKILFTLAATFTRISLILFFYRLVKDAQIKWYRWMLHASIIWTVAVGITFIFLSIFICLPIKAYWTWPPMPTQQCIDEGVVVLAAGIINSVTDLMVTLLPVPIIMRLRLPVKQRLGVLVLLCLGIVVTAAGVVRTYYIWKSLIDSWDITWYAFYLWIAACVEIDLAVICACAPALKPLFSGLASRMSNGISSIVSPRPGSPGSVGTYAVSKENLAPGIEPGWRPPKPMRKQKRGLVDSKLSTFGSWLGRAEEYAEPGDLLGRQGSYGQPYKEEEIELVRERPKEDDSVLYIRGSRI
ncbi:hypothetical protein CAC42_6073 [Sphaceloma murrayae]|uniref:Rhodopsin domain-containing protein n=1 Tax=Sphaceloma murrayae TaxID=2082308 RepID=A0A2K1QV86_9PEZI|nr:hypothetical protein CAC42_6073 [Sphaceloma murrayae]